MRVLVVTHMYPTAEHPANGVFVQQQVESLRREGIGVDVLHVDVTRSKWLYPWSFVPYLQRVLTPARRYDLVHAHYVFAGVVARSQLRFPVVLTHHGDETFHGWQARLCRVMSRLVDRAIVVTEQMRKALGLESAVVIPCGVDFGLFRPLPRDRCRAELGLPTDKKLVLFAGDITKSLKRLDIAQAAVALLRSQGEDVELVIAHAKPYEQVPLFMNACDALVLASEREGSPQVVKEAVACNLPVVSVEVGDVPEILRGIANCYICPRDPAQIAEKLGLVLESGLRANGRELARRYDLACTAREIVKVYESVVSEKRARRTRSRVATRRWLA